MIRFGRLLRLLILFSLLFTSIAHAQDYAILGNINIDKGVDSVVLSPNTGIAYGINSEVKAVYIFNLQNYTLKKSIKLGRKPIAIAVNPSNNTAYITAKDDKGQGLLFVVDSDGKVSSVTLPKDPQGIAIYQNTALIAIEQDKQIICLSLDTLNITKTIQLSRRPRYISIDEDSNRMIVVAGESAGEGKQNRLMIIDLNSGNVSSDLQLKKEMRSLTLDSSKDKAVAVSDEGIYLIDINTLDVKIIPVNDNALSVDKNESTHKTVIASEKGFLILDVDTRGVTAYPLGYKTQCVAVDRLRNTALLGTNNNVIEIQLPNPMPKITNLIPKNARMEDNGFNLNVAGEKFITTSSVEFNNQKIDTTFGDNENLSAVVPSEILTTSSDVPVTVTNPAPSGGTSAPYSFTIKAPAPIASSIYPDSAYARTAGFTLKVNGSYFGQGYIVNFNGQDLVTTYINSSELNAILPSSLIQAKGEYFVTVISSDRQNSNFLKFTVLDAYPNITGFTPTEGISGTAVTITGDNFTGARVYFGTLQATIAKLTQTAIKAIVPAGATTAPITITTSIGSATSSANFTITKRQDFSIQAMPQSISLPNMGAGSVIISLITNGVEPFNGVVTLSTDALPEGMIASFSPSFISVNQTSVFTIGMTNSLSSQTVIGIKGTASIDNGEVIKTTSLIVNPIPEGTTTLSGRVLASKDEKPLSGVSITLGNFVSITDSAGGFLFIDPPVGEQVIIIDGHTANTETATYPSAIPMPVTVYGGIPNQLFSAIYVHEVNTKYFTVIDPSKETIVTDPNISDFEMRIPIGVQIIGLDGVPNERVSVTPVPVDRLPIVAPPPGVYVSEIYMYYFFKPGGGTPTQPIPVKMPNRFAAKPGERIQLWYYDESATPDPNSNQWKVFGMGTVSDDGRQIIPDSGVGIPKFCCGASMPARPKAPDFQPGHGCPIADPVDPFSGTYLYDETDFSVGNTGLMTIQRFYNSGNAAIGIFGRGTASNFSHYLMSIADTFSYTPPEGGTNTFSKNPDGSYTNSNNPSLSGAIAYDNGETRTLRFRNGNVLIFNKSGVVIEEQDANGNWVKINRDGLDNITGFLDSYGQSLRITTTTYTTSRKIYTLITSIKDEAGRIVFYEYDGGGNLVSFTNPAGGKTIYTYDSMNKLSSKTNPSGVVEVSNTYSYLSGRILKQVHADGGVYSFVYHSGILCEVTSVCSGSGGGGVCSPVKRFELCDDPYVPIPASYRNLWSWLPVQPSQATSVTATDPLGNTTTYTHTSGGYLKTKTDPVGQTTKYSMDFSTNRVNAVTDPLGRTTSFTYDGFGNTTAVTDPAGNITSYEYEPVFGKPTKITDALGHITNFAYDDRGNLTSATSPKGEATAIAYNSIGKPISVTDALGNVYAFDYDSYGNLMKATDPQGNNALMAYDALGRLTSLTDPKGKSTGYGYDDMNRATAIADALGGMTQFAYDPDGNLTSVKDAKGHTINYAYNARKRVSSMTDQLGHIESYVYDGNDNLTAVTDRKGQVTTFSYDLLDRITSVNYSDGSYTTYVYDAVGRLTSIYDSVSGVIEYVYSNTGCSACGSSSVDKVIKEITPLGTVSYTYDALGRRTSMTVSGQEPVYYSYDEDGRLVSLSSTGMTFGFEYDAIGRRTALSYPNGQTTAYSYNAGSNLLSIENLSPLNAVLEKVSYSYDPNGNRTKVDRLNVSPKSSQPMTASYDSANKMVTFNSENLLYDDNGNLVQKGDTSYQWDARGRLVGMSSPAVNASFKYDALGRRIEKSINGKTTQYLYDGLDIIQEIEDGMVSVNYIRSLSIDEPLAMINKDGVYFYIYDGLGSVVGLTDSSGSEVVQYSYDTFGNTSTNNPDFNNPFQYTGRENDETGLYYYRARYYSPELHRFVSEDPIGLLGGMNKYSYVNNNPTNYIDPFGLNPVAGAVVGGFVGGPPGAAIGAGVGIGIGLVGGQMLWDNVIKPWYDSNRLPTGSKPIDQTPWSGDHKGIKGGVGAKPSDSTWISPDGHVWTQNPDGSYEDNGPAGNYTGSGKPSGKRGKDRNKKGCK